MRNLDGDLIGIVTDISLVPPLLHTLSLSSSSSVLVPVVVVSVLYCKCTGCDVYSTAL